MSTSFKFAFSAAALRAASALMAFNKASLAAEKSGTLGDLDPREAERAMAALAAEVPEDLPEGASLGDFFSAICEHVDAPTLAAVQESKRRHHQAQEDKLREKQQKMFRAIASAAGIPEDAASIIGFYAQIGMIGTAPSATEPVEVPGEGTIHVYGLAELRLAGAEVESDGA